MTRERLANLLQSFPSLCIAVLGDFFLDKYLDVDPSVSERSLETGLEARQVVEVRKFPGAAGTVASNLKALGVGGVHAMGFVGCDGEGFDLLRALRNRGIETGSVIMSQGMRTPTYMKPMVAGREMERLDIQNRKPPSRKLQSKVVSALAKAAPRLDGVMVSDQCTHAFGLVSEWMRERLAELVRDFPALTVLVDSRARIGEFRGMCVKPNASEAASALGHEVTAGNAVDAARALRERGARRVFVTLGARGIAFCGEDGEGIVPAPPAPQEIDIVGAGDAAAAGMLCALCAGASTQEAAELANLCAGVTIRKIGVTGTASPREVVELAALSVP
ncbi:MAG: hypothetical protein AMXMBFR61_11520 [Fimbriimonadales bacterium]